MHTTIKQLLLLLLLIICISPLHANTYTVTGTGNSGAGTLRAAIDSANSHSGLDTINFNLGAGGPFVITLTSALPSLTDNAGVLINGWDNSGNNGTQNAVLPVNATSSTPMNAAYKIIISNTNGNVNSAFIASSNNNTIQGLVLPDFGVTTLSVNDTCIMLRGNNNKVLGCYIGIDSSGTTGNRRTEVAISITGANNNIGNGTAAGANIIAGTNDSLTNHGGIFILGANASGNTIKGNMIGLQKDGESATITEKQQNGIIISGGAINTVIGGTGSGDGNIISGNQYRGLHVATNCNNTRIEGNIVGPEANGLSVVSGVTQARGVFIGSANNTIGSSVTAARNIISGNSYGIFIDGTTATGNSVKGNYIGIGADGTTYLTGNTQNTGIFLSQSSYNTIGGTAAGERNVISGNGSGTGSGITLYNDGPPAAHHETIIGNIIGPKNDGSTWLTDNQEYGIIIQGYSNTIGGNTSSHRNIISANGKYGVYLRSPGGNCYSNIIKGNYIGVASNGTSVITSSSQDYGVYISATTSSTQPRLNVIGGALSSEANVISGNNNGSSAGTGVYIETTHASGNTVKGNIIGPKNDGTTFLSNIQSTGIQLNNAQAITIGGNTAADRNIISANGSYGVYVRGAAASGNVIKGNYIGIASNGSSYITSSGQDIGVYIAAAGFQNKVGGALSGEGNVISGNTVGVKIDSSATQNTVAGNIIGLNEAGTVGISPAQTYGVHIQSSPSNTIGGVTSSYRNIITGNSTGVLVTGAASTGTAIKANYIGLNAAGTAYISSPSQVNGIQVGDAANAFNPSGVMIGGTSSGEGNVISGNSSYGVFLTLYSGGTSIKGNIIGLQADGNTRVTGASQDYGVFVSRCADNSIGGTAAGESNIISGNTSAGILVSGAEASGNKMSGNYIGPRSTGTAAVTSGSQDYGIYLFSSTNKNLIHGNLISGNTVFGMNINVSSVGSNTVTANIIGPQQDGLSNMGIQPTGIYLNNNPGTLIGGATAGERNIISANTSIGIVISNTINNNITPTCEGTSITGNYIGLASNGTSLIASSSQDYGIYLSSSASNMIIGGTGTGEGNVISGNTDAGIYITGGGKNTIAGNIIGAAASGTTSLGASNNQEHGVYITSSLGNKIGGATAGYRNIISDNSTYGVYLTGSTTTGNLIKGNYIGTATDGSSLITSSSQDYGVYAVSGASSNTIGGYSSAGDPNIIAHNIADGIHITGASTHYNLISRNKIFSNTNKGINLNGSGNDNKTAPAITSYTLGILYGTAEAHDSVEIFSSSGSQNANQYLATVKADSLGGWSLNLDTILIHQFFIATAKDSAGTHFPHPENTSEFSDIFSSCSIVTVNLVPDDTSICIGTCTEIIASGANTYVWSPVTGLSSATASTVTACPTVVTTYTVTGTFLNGCSATSHISITFDSLLIISVGNDTSICYGQSILLGGSPTVTGCDPIVYNWSPANGLSSVAVANPLASPDTTTLYTLTIMDANEVFAVDSVLITVNELPELLVVTRDTSVCTGQSVQISTGGTGSFSWSPTAGLSSASSPNPVAAPDSSTEYSVVLTSAAGCESGGRVGINVFAIPGLSVSNDTTIYLGMGATLYANSSVIDYSWLPVAGLDNPLSASPFATPIDTTVYTVTVTNGPCSSQDSVKVNVVLPPSPVFSYSFPGLSSQFITDVSTPALAYNWDFGDGNTSNIAAPSHTYLLEGTYTVCLTITTIFGDLTFCDYAVNIHISPVPCCE